MPPAACREQRVGEGDAGGANRAKSLHSGASQDSRSFPGELLQVYTAVDNMVGSTSFTTITQESARDNEAAAGGRVGWCQVEKAVASFRVEAYPGTLPPPTPSRPAG